MHSFGVLSHAGAEVSPMLRPLPFPLPLIASSSLTTHLIMSHSGPESPDSELGSFTNVLCDFGKVPSYFWASLL